MTTASTVGAALRAAGLTERATNACFDVRCAHHAPLRAPTLPQPGDSPPRAAIAPWMFVVGRSFPEPVVRRAFGDAVDALIELGALHLHDGRVVPTVAIVPVGEALTVCDRFDAAAPDVMFPDDSAYHLIGALPRRRVGSWLDVGTGNAIAPLAARGRAERIRATDIHAPAINRARLGAELSAVAPIDLAIADLTAGARAGAPWDLITFNAPIPAEAGAPDTTCAYTASPAGARLLERFWEAVPELVANDGEVIVHSVCASPPPVAGGSVAIALYTPDDAQIPFGITSWRPSGPAGTAVAKIALTPSVPHVHRGHLRP